MPAGGLGRDRGADVVLDGGTTPLEHEQRTQTSTKRRARRAIDA
jgi:hypothetical protein